MSAGRETAKKRGGKQYHSLFPFKRAKVDVVLENCLPFLHLGHDFVLVQRAHPLVEFHPGYKRTGEGQIVCTRCAVLNVVDGDCLFCMEVVLRFHLCALCVSVDNGWACREDTRPNADVSTFFTTFPCLEALSSGFPFCMWMV